eukprot:720490-Hanusia_phi.AAC.1
MAAGAPAASEGERQEAFMADRLREDLEQVALDRDGQADALLVLSDPPAETRHSKEQHLDRAGEKLPHLSGHRSRSMSKSSDRVH